MSNYDICIVGGAGHIGAPLAILFANQGLKVLICDINIEAMNTIKNGKLPFLENGSEILLTNALKLNNLFFTNQTDQISQSKTIILTIGTPIDEFHNPKIHEIIKCLDELPINNNHLLILRSTVFPGVSKYVSRYLATKNLFPLIAFCPERIVQGDAIREMQKLPQIVSGITEEAANQAALLFQMIAPQIIRLKPAEAEFAKLFSNAYRYIQFAITNQFYEMATTAGLNYNTILDGAKQDYFRLHDLPSAGFAAGPCLFKDTLQLCAYSEGKFNLGDSAIKANEGLPAFLVSQLEKDYELKNYTVGLLGMSFKSNIDDARSSLSYKLKKILTFKAKAVLTTDPFVQDSNLLSLDEVINYSDILIICAPHDKYRNLATSKKVINIWHDSIYRLV
jgi:UDP-N-acetyl-D-mannosaminuronic acid dehydrogenase